MTATDELRRLLDERGVEWWPSDERWNADVITHWYAGLLKWTAIEGEDGLWVNADVAGHNSLTPEQAIAATLGAGTCHMELREDACTSAYQDAYECSKCGEWVLRETFMGESEPPRFCPNCGAKVVSE